MARTTPAAFPVILGLALGSALPGCGAPATSDAADVVFSGGAVYTVDDARPWAEAVAVRGDAIVYVGDEAGLEPYLGRETRRIDLDGGLLLPGFIDTHMHLITGGAYATALSLDTFGTVDEWIDAIEAYAADNPDDDVIFGYGFLATTFGPAGPMRQQIDAVVPERPVLIVDEGLHGGWANTAALERLGINRDTPDPLPGYSYYKRDADGEATGYLLEDTVDTAIDALDIISAERVIEGTGIIIDTMNAYGVTAAFDAGVLENDLGMARRVLEALATGGELTLRIAGSARVESPEGVDEAVRMTRRWAEALDGPRYRYDTLKIPLDGTIEGRTAAMFEDYQGEPGNAGKTVFTELEMIEMTTEAAGGNVDVHVHALGERAVHETLNAIEVARMTHPDSDSRFTVCHVEVVIDEDVPRFAELDVIAQTTPLWFSYDTYGEQFVSEDQFQRYWPFRSIAEAGARVTFGSDFPASGAGTLGLSPVVQIEIGHTRQSAGEPDAPVQPRETERLDLATLVRGFTRDAAYQLRMEDEIGSIEAGKRADLVVLDRNIFETDPYAIHETGVVMTMLDGAVVYDRGETDAGS